MMAKSKGKGPAGNPAMIRKGIYLSALVYVEGDQTPASDFAAVAQGALRQALSSAVGGLIFTVKSLEVKNDLDMDDGGGDQGGGDKKAGKFEF